MFSWILVFGGSLVEVPVFKLMVVVNGLSADWELAECWNAQLIVWLMHFFVMVLEWQLDRLKARDLLQDVNLASWTTSNIIHDLYQELAEVEGDQLDESADLEKWRWTYVDNGDLSKLERSPGRGCWHQYWIRLDVYEPSYSPDRSIESLDGFGWQLRSNVVVFKKYTMEHEQFLTYVSE